MPVDSGRMTKFMLDVYQEAQQVALETVHILPVVMVGMVGHRLQAEPAARCLAVVPPATGPLCGGGQAPAAGGARARGLHLGRWRVVATGGGDASVTNARDTE